MNADSKKITIDLLRDLNRNFKSGDVQIQNSTFAILCAIDLIALDAGLIMYIHYLKGKYHYLNYKRNDSLASIEKAFECYGKVF